MSSEKVTGHEAAQAALDAIKIACENLHQNIVVAVIENPDAIKKLALTAQDQNL